MPRLLAAAIVAACLTLFAMLPVNAQAGIYDDNALRVEGLRGDFRIVRGTEGIPVGKIGVFRGIDVTRLVASSEKATIEAKRFARDYKPGVLLLSLGIATLGAGIGVSEIQNVNRVITTGLMLAGTSLIVYGAGRLENAYNALSRSIWWYNRDLKQ